MLYYQVSPNMLFSGYIWEPFFQRLFFSYSPHKSDDLNIEGAGPGIIAEIRNPECL